MTAPTQAQQPFAAVSGHVLHQGDCRDVMRAMLGWSVGLAFLDPPYNLSKEDQAIARNVRPNSPIAADKGEWDRMTPEDYEALMTGALDQVRRVLRPGGNLVVCCTHHEEDNLKRWIAERFELLNRLIWSKTNPPPTFARNRLGFSHETLFIARKRGAVNVMNLDVVPYAERLDVWRGPICAGQSLERVKGPDGRSLHPTQKPLWLVERAVRVFSNAGDLVVDPFAGVCTTAVACQRHERPSISIDLNPTYLAAGARRLQG